MRSGDCARRIAAFTTNRLALTNRTEDPVSHITLSRLVALLVVVSAILVPAASAQPIDSFLGQSPASDAQTDIGTAVAIQPKSASGGFDWSDAGLGAAGMLVVLSAGVAVVVTIRRSRNLATG